MVRGEEATAQELWKELGDLSMVDLRERKAEEPAEW